MVGLLYQEAPGLGNDQSTSGWKTLQRSIEQVAGVRGCKHTRIVVIGPVFDIIPNAFLKLANSMFG